MKADRINKQQQRVSGKLNLIEAKFDVLKKKMKLFRVNL